MNPEFSKFSCSVLRYMYVRFPYRPGGHAAGWHSCWFMYGHSSMRRAREHFQASFVAWASLAKGLCSAWATSIRVWIRTRIHIWNHIWTYIGVHVWIYKFVIEICCLKIKFRSSIFEFRSSECKLRILEFLEIFKFLKISRISELVEFLEFAEFLELQKSRNSSK